MRRAIAFAGSVSAIALLALPISVAAQTAPMQPMMWVEKTPNYIMALTVGPAEEMLSPSQAMSGQSGEVMVSGGPMAPASTSMMGSSSSSMSTGSSMGSSMSDTMSDQGMPANHHLEVHITDASGAVVNDVTPDIRVIDKATGERRDLPEVMGMFGSAMGPSDFHYGQNVWLPDGTYTIEVMVGPDTAQFRDVMVSGGAPSMPMASSMGQ